MDEKLILYLRNYCGYCAMVQDVISELAVDVEERNIWENDTWQNELVVSQGRSTDPVLYRKAATGESYWLPESDAIIRYLIQTYD